MTTIQPRSFTFYSYKGGVGRSMALLNLAYHLHARGRHVLVVDLDLDAPGASSFLHRSGELVENEDTGDVVDVLAALVEAVRQPSTGAAPPVPALRLESFLRSIKPEKYAPATHPRAPRARFDVLAADDSRLYTDRFAALNLPGLTADQIAAVSEMLRALLFRHRFPFQQPWQADEEPPEDTAYDYILIDSRTGFSEIGGLCVGPLADRLIVLCGLNDQNIAGTRRFLELVGLEPKPRPADSKPWDDADRPDGSDWRPSTLGPKPTLLVASPVPGGEMTYKKERMGVMEQKIGIAPLKLSYHPQMALMETIFVRDHSDEYLALEYGTLGERVMSLVGDTAVQWNQLIQKGLRESRGKASEDRVSLDFPKVTARIALEMGHLAWVVPIKTLADCGVSELERDQIRRVRIYFAHNAESAARGWLDWADELDTEEARHIGDPNWFRSMNEKYALAVAAKPDFHEALFNWGLALLHWAKARGGDDAEALYSEVGKKFGAGLAINPGDSDAFINWGGALIYWARTKTGTEAEALLSEAGEKFRAALAINPAAYDALNNWGISLLDWAKIKSSAETEFLLDKAGEKFQAALAIKPEFQETLYNLACLAALRGDAGETVRELERWKQIHPTPSRAKLDADTDFDRVRSDPRFVAFRDSLGE